MPEAAIPILEGSLKMSKRFINPKKNVLATALAVVLFSTATLAQSVRVNDKDRDDFVRGCIRSCVVKTQSDPTAKEWKMTEGEMTSVCTCNCNEMGNRLSQDLADSLRDKDRMTIQTNAAMQRITRESMDICYPRFFESRAKK